MSSNATVTVADILELRADGLSEEEVWSLLCQSVQTLQDLFLSDEIKTRIPLVTPLNLEISNKGKVVISCIDEIEEDARRFLAPEWMEDGSSAADPEKMWVYSLGKTLHASLKLTDVIKTGNLGLVLSSMTDEKPSSRASLMHLLNVISERCETNLPGKPFSHLVMDMHREIFGIPPQCLSSLSSGKGSPSPRSRDEGNESSQPNASSPGEEVVISEKTSSATKSPAAIRAGRNPVQRAPSRLYRAPAGSERNFRGGCSNPNSCIGPEFVVRSSEPARVLWVGDSKPSQPRTVTVVHLDGTRTRMICDPNTITCGKIFETVVRLEKLEDNFIFGLAFLTDGDFVFLPPETKLHKVAPNGWKDGRNGTKSPSAIQNFLLFVRVKFFLPNLRGIRNWTTKHLLYLQLRRSLIEQQIKCDVKELLSLGGLALQAEFGNHTEREHGRAAYFLLEHYLPEEVIGDRPNLESQLQELHKSRHGLDPGKAEEIFVAQTQMLPEYGSHHSTAQWVRKSVTIPMWVTVNLQGVYLYEKKKNVLDRKVHEAFTWKNIQRLKCTERYFFLAPRSVGRQKLTSYKLRMENKKSFFFFRLASFHHQFFLKLRVELSSLHSLSLEFGIPVTKSEKDDNRKNRNQECIMRKEAYQDWKRREEDRHQNKENENPSEERRDKRKGVKMGVRAFHSAPGETFFDPVPGRRLSVSTEASNGSSHAFVLDSSLKSFDEKFSYDLQETIPSILETKFDQVSWEEERLLRRVILEKDKYGSFGLEVIEGSRGGIFIENVLAARKESGEAESVRKGDQVMSANGICLLNMCYKDALNVLKGAGDRVELLVSRSCGIPEARPKPVEFEYLRNIRYDIALEVDAFEPEIAVTNVPITTLEGKNYFRPFST